MVYTVPRKARPPPTPFTHLNHENITPSFMHSQHFSADGLSPLPSTSQILRYQEPDDSDLSPAVLSKLGPSIRANLEQVLSSRTNLSLKTLSKSNTLDVTRSVRSRSGSYQPRGNSQVSVVVPRSQERSRSRSTSIQPHKKGQQVTANPPGGLITPPDSGASIIEADQGDIQVPHPTSPSPMQPRSRTSSPQKKANPSVSLTLTPRRAPARRTTSPHNKRSRDLVETPVIARVKGNSANLAGAKGSPNPRAKKNTRRSPQPEDEDDDNDDEEESETEADSSPWKPGPSSRLSTGRPSSAKKSKKRVVSSTLYQSEEEEEDEDDDDDDSDFEVISFKKRNDPEATFIREIRRNGWDRMELDSPIKTTYLPSQELPQRRSPKVEEVMTGSPSKRQGSRARSTSNAPTTAEVSLGDISIKSSSSTSSDSSTTTTKKAGWRRTFSSSAVNLSVKLSQKTRRASAPPPNIGESVSDQPTMPDSPSDDPLLLRGPDLSHLSFSYRGTNSVIPEEDEDDGYGMDDPLIFESPSKRTRDGVLTSTPLPAARMPLESMQEQDVDQSMQQSPSRSGDDSGLKTGEKQADSIAEISGQLESNTFGQFDDYAGGMSSDEDEQAEQQYAEEESFAQAYATREDLTTEDVLAAEFTRDDDVTHEDITQQDLTHEDGTNEHSHSEEISGEDVTHSDATRATEEDLSIEQQDESLSLEEQTGSPFNSSEEEADVSMHAGVAEASMSGEHDAGSDEESDFEVVGQAYNPDQDARLRSHSEEEEEESDEEEGDASGSQEEEGETSQVSEDGQEGTSPDTSNAVEILAGSSSLTHGEGEKDSSSSDEEGFKVVSVMHSAKYRGKQRALPDEMEDPSPKVHTVALVDVSSRSTRYDQSASMNISQSRIEKLSQPTTTPIIEISSLDPRAAAKATAFLKLYHQYVEEGWIQGEESTSTTQRQKEIDAGDRAKVAQVVRIIKEAERMAAKPNDSGNVSLSLPQILMDAELQASQKDEDEADEGMHLKTPAPRAALASPSTPHLPGGFPRSAAPKSAARIADTTVWTRKDWITLDRFFSTHIKSLARTQLSESIDSVDAQILALTHNLDFTLLAQQFLAQTATTAQDEWSLSKIQFRLPALQRKYLRRLETRYPGRVNVDHARDESMELNWSLTRTEKSRVSFGTPYRLGAHSTPHHATKVYPSLENVHKAQESPGVMARTTRVLGSFFGTPPVLKRKVVDIPTEIRDFGFKQRDERGTGLEQRASGRANISAEELRDVASKIRAKRGSNEGIKARRCLFQVPQRTTTDADRTTSRRTTFAAPPKVAEPGPSSCRTTLATTAPISSGGIEIRRSNSGRSAPIAPTALSLLPSSSHPIAAAKALALNQSRLERGWKSPRSKRENAVRLSARSNLSIHPL